MNREYTDAPATDNNPASPATLGTVSRVLTLLEVLAESSGSFTVKYVAEKMQLPPSTVHRLLHLLKKDGFVEGTPEGRHYLIGPQFYRVAAQVVDSVSPPQLAQRTLDEIARTYDETVLYGMYLPTEQAFSFESRADGQQKLVYQIDRHKPLSLVWGASGKSILAFLPTEIVRDILAGEGASSASGAPPPDDATLESELALIRERGYAVSAGEKLPDARGIAAPVFGPKGVIGCICLTSPKSRKLNYSIDKIGLDISARARALSRDLGAF